MRSDALFPIFDQLNLLRRVRRDLVTDRHEASKLRNLLNHIVPCRQAMPPKVTADHSAGPANAGEAMDKDGVVIGN